MVGFGLMQVVNTSVAISMTGWRMGYAVWPKALVDKSIATLPYR